MDKLEKYSNAIKDYVENAPIPNGRKLVLEEHYFESFFSMKVIYAVHTKNKKKRI